MRNDLISSMSSIQDRTYTARAIDIRHWYINTNKCMQFENKSNCQIINSVAAAAVVPLLR